MIIKVDTSSLKQTKWHEYALRFVAGGLITAVAGMVAKKWGPQVGGLMLAFPAIFPAAVTFIAKHEREKKTTQKGIDANFRGMLAASLGAAGTSMGSVGLVAFALVVVTLLPAHNSVVVLVASTITWLLVSSMVWLAWRARHRLGL